MRNFQQGEFTINHNDSSRTTRRISSKRDKSIEVEENLESVELPESLLEELLS